MRAWEHFLKAQEKELGAKTVSKWLRSLRVVHYDACNLYLEAKDAFQVLWFDEHFPKKKLENFVNSNQKKIKIHLFTAENSPHFQKKKQQEKDQRQNPKLENSQIIFDSLDSFCTFDNFVASESNLLAYKLLCKITNYDPVSGKFIASEGLAAFNPIFLAGGEGSGKTHLLMATAHALKDRGLNVLYSKAETFTTHVVSAIRSSEVPAFRKAYRNADVLIIDDVHVLSKKTATQEELFHTFNTLHLQGKEIILSANCLPSELQGIEPRLISRFEWGIVLSLHPLSEDARRKILEKKSETIGFTLDSEIQSFLLSTFSSSTKSLVQSLDALILRCHLGQEKETPPYSLASVKDAKNVLQDLIAKEKQSTPTAEEIIRTVSEYFEIQPEDIYSNAKSRECALPRHLAMHLCREKLKIPYSQIGQIFSRNHTTIASGVKLIDKGIKTLNKEILEPYQKISKKLR